ncbi:MAG: DNA-3-methyladenine glycosylase I, partial [Pseudomonadota bacterium]
MRHFDEIFAIAADRKGGADALRALIDPSPPASVLAATPDDRILAHFSKAVFCAGFNWNVVDNMWPGFEKAFHGFDVGKCAMMNDEWFDELITDTGIVRYGAK